MKLGGGHYIRLTVTPVFDSSDSLTHLIALTRETTDETQQQLKVDAIHEAGDELADLTPDELAEMAVEERTDLLKYNITRHMRDLLGLDFIEIRLLDRTTNRLIPLLTEGMTPLAANRELYARPEGNGVTGFVAATGKTYVCPDTTKDPRYIEGAAGSRSSLTVPLTIHGTVIGTLNVESPQPNAFDERDRQFIEIYGRNIAAAINTLELLQAEKATTARTQVEAINRELALPLDDIIADATTVLDRYAGHDEDIISRLRHLLYRAREIRSLIHKAGVVPPGPNQPVPGARAPARRHPASGCRFRRGHPPLGPSPARLPGGKRRDRPRRPRGDRPHAPGAVLGRSGRYSLARPGRLRSLQTPSRSAAKRTHHPHDRLRLGSHSFDRQGPPRGPSDRALQTLPSRSLDGSRRASPPLRPRRPAGSAPAPRQPRGSLPECTAHRGTPAAGPCPPEPAPADTAGERENPGSPLDEAAPHE